MKFEINLGMNEKCYKKMNKVVFLIGLIFSPLAALTSFFITYEEYKHHYPENKIPIKKAMETALITFFVFLTLSFFIAIIINKII
ncbi:MAG: hypothetical protein ACYCXB_02840 [Candidatus Humimicrobiaceae bacterium]